MRQKLYGNNIQPACELCANGRRSLDGKAVLCTKKGVMPLYHHCRRFAYDPLRRFESVPGRQIKSIYGAVEQRILLNMPL